MKFVNFIILIFSMNAMAEADINSLVQKNITNCSSKPHIFAEQLNDLRDGLSDIIYSTKADELTALLNPKNLEGQLVALIAPELYPKASLRVLYSRCWVNYEEARRFAAKKNVTGSKEKIGYWDACNATVFKNNDLPKLASEIKSCFMKLK